MVNIKNNKKGAQGIGTLIVFIAMILVAAVAAGVLIQTSSSLQSKALDVGRQSQERLTTDIEVIQVFAETARDGNITADTDKITFVIRLGSGSTPIKMEDLLIRFDAPEGQQSLNFGSGAASATNYSVVYKIDGEGHQDGYLSSGDLAEVSFVYGGTITDDLVEGETGTLRLVTKNGAVKPITVTTPSAMTDAIVYLYP